MTLKDIAIFKLKTLVANFNAKLSAATENNANSQILCLVHENNDLFFRYTSYDDDETRTNRQHSTQQQQQSSSSGPEPLVIVKLLPWFNEHGKVIQGISFDPSNERLLVLCDDNTLHIVPVLAIVQEQQQKFDQESGSSRRAAAAQSDHSQTITSYVIPFVGPHECPNPRTCPNNFYKPQKVEKSLKTISADLKRSPPTLDDLYSKQAVDKLLSSCDASSTYFRGDEVAEEGASSRVDEEPMESKENGRITPPDEAAAEEDVKRAAVVCPYPTAVVWWQTKRKQDRAIVGYSDGSVCFLSLTPNCPFIANSTLTDSVDYFDICKDASGQTVTLLINTSKNTQWKLLLEEEQSRYTFPGDALLDNPTPSTPNSVVKPGGDSKIDQDWQFVVATTPPQITVSSPSSHPVMGSSGGTKEAEEMVQSMPKLFPTTRAGISYLREMGTKKIGALKQRLSEKGSNSRGRRDVETPDMDDIKRSDEDDWADEPVVTFDVLETPSVIPEMITSAAGPKIVVKNHNTRTALFALHERQETVSVHNLNMDPEPFYVYCLPENCQDMLMTQNTIYTVQRVNVGQRNGRVGGEVPENMMPEGAADGEGSNEGQILACGVVSKTLAIKNKDSDMFEDKALVTYFPFPAEKVVNIHGQFTRYPSTLSSRLNKRREQSTTTTKESSQNGRLTVKDYVKQRAQFEGVDGGGADRIGPGAEIINDVRILETAFPHVEFESCLVVTDKNAYAVELNEAPEVIFMNFARQSMWSSCKYFCDIFNVPMAQCIEFVGDELLRQHKVTQALVTYNVAQIPPIKTALKLATYGESNALLHLCAMALKCVFVLKSSRPSGGHAKELMLDLPLRTIPQKSQAGVKRKSATAAELNCGHRCSDFSYDHDEVGMDVQMSFSSQFHLSNLMFLTLCEKTLTEKNYFPLWSFVQLNPRFHTTLASTILSQGGMYSTAVLLAKVRGAGLDVFMALVKAVKQEFGTDINYLLYNLSDGMFRECVTYLSSVAVDYFNAIKRNLQKFSIHVVNRLVEQLNPFAVAFRPIVSRLSALRHAHRRRAEDDGDELFPVYCKSYVEAFLAVLLRSFEMKEGAESVLINGLTNINIRYESTAFPVNARRLGQVAAGYAHACRAVNGNAYIWGSNQIPYVVDDNFGAMAPGIESSSLGKGPRKIKFLSNLNIVVLSVHCGRTHSLMYTNNGLYSMGANNLGQLGVGGHISQSLHPVLVETLVDQNVELIAVGQYHNAVVANGRLYVWGWGVYGQLGNGGIEDVQVPTELPFFTGRKIKQISLGHVHSLVLCESESKMNFLEDLYVFGSNYFGQLGIGSTAEPGEEKGMSKALVPIKLDFDGERIRFIHTNFFVNFAVTESNELYTWGASPQALRVINQARKRARSQIRSEMAKEKEAKEQQEESKENSNPEEADMEGASGPFEKKENETPKEKHREMRPKIEARKTRRHSLSNMNKLKLSRKSPGRIHKSPSDESLPQRPIDGPPSLKRRSDTSPDADNGEPKYADSPPGGNSEGRPDLTDLEEWTEHLRPIRVDTGNLEEEEIMEVSSGLYHFALRTEKGVYTWGKNIEKQLGNDSSRADVQIPTQLDTIKRPLSVACGADFTLVLVENASDHGETLLAFGNNNMGQCGRETGDKTALMGKWVRLKISKRHIRIPDGSACVSAPTEVLFPEKGAGKASGQQTQVAPIKSLPQFKRKFFTTSGYLRGLEEKRELDGEGSLERGMGSIQLSRSSECSEDVSPDDDEEMRIVSLSKEEEQIERNGEALENKSAPVKISPKLEILRNGLPVERMPAEFIHYCLYLFYGIYDMETVAGHCAFAEFRIRLKMLQLRFFEAFRLALAQVAGAEGVATEEKVRQSLILLEFFTKDENLIPMHEEDLKYFIQETFVAFIERDWDLEPLEAYFKANLSLYVIPLAYVLFFDEAPAPPINVNGDGTERFGAVGSSDAEGASGNAKQLRDSVLLKYRTFFNHLECGANKYHVAGAERIFEKVSCVFNAMICQRVVEIFEEVIQ